MEMDVQVHAYDLGSFTPAPRWSSPRGLYLRLLPTRINDSDGETCCLVSEGLGSGWSSRSTGLCAHWCKTGESDCSFLGVSSGSILFFVKKNAFLTQSRELPINVLQLPQLPQSSAWSFPNGGLSTPLPQEVPQVCSNDWSWSMRAGCRYLLTLTRSLPVDTTIKLMARLRRCE